MAGGGIRRISAASARAHTRKHKKSAFSSLIPSPGLMKKFLLVSSIGLLAWAYQACLPPPSKICGTSDGPQVTAARVKLRDGRHLAYKESGISKEKAKYKIVFIHGFDSCRHDSFPITMGLDEELGIYMVAIDRPGYGESDPDPKRSEKSLALDIEDFADRLKLGATFYVIGHSMGGEIVWGCLKYIPHRLAGATLLAPVINYWWPGFPAELTKKGYEKQLMQDQWTLRVAHHLPWLTYWWNSQKWFPASSVIARHPASFSPADIEIISKLPRRDQYAAQVRQQGEYESLHRDMIVGFGKWEFDPMDLNNSFLNREEVSVHIWQGDDDRLVSVQLQRYIAQKLPWIQYHELPGAGHLFPVADGMFNSIDRKSVV